MSLLSLRGIEKRYGGVRALRSGSLEVAAGEVHLLMGENGAGKSTLMKITAGLTQPDGGEFLWRGQAQRFRSPSDAAAVGIAMVHQESLLAPHLTVAENLFLGREECGRFGWMKRAQMRERAVRLIEEHHFPIQADARVDRLSPAGRQLVEICRALVQGSSLLIFDEPTSSLSDAETREVFRLVKSLRDRGMGVIYITHRLEELREVGDRVTVLRDGETVHTGALRDLTINQLIRHMVGREVSALYAREPVPAGEQVLRVEGLSRAPLLRDISFSIRAGEIVGLAGLVGAGRTELCRALFGIDRLSAGRVWIGGKLMNIRSPRDAVRAGLALIPEDRQHAGLARELSIARNIALTNLDAVSSGGFVRREQEFALTEKYKKKLAIRLDSPAQLAGRLSGGNQQKVVIAKWLARGARVFLFDEPTRGIDVGAKREVFQIMDELAREGAAVLMVSSELPELLQVPDRILVMRNGRLAGELPGRTTQEEIINLAAFRKEPAA